MADGESTEVSVDDPISYEFVWTLDRIHSKDGYFDLLDMPEKDRWPNLVVTIIGLTFMALSAGAYMLELEDHLNRQFTAAFALGGLLMFAMFLVFGFMEARRTQRAPINPYIEWLLNLPPYNVSLAHDGVEYISTFERARWKWASFQKFSECPAGILLIMGPKVALLVPDDALPDGLSRADAMHKLKRWKGPW